MPCNLAVTITKATVLPEHLQSLLTPAVVKTLVPAFLQQHPEYNSAGHISAWNQGDTVVFSVGDFTITVSKDTQVTVNTIRLRREAANKLAEQITTLLSIGADRMFVNQVQQVLTAKFGAVYSQTATVDNQGTQERVSVFMLEI